MVLRRNSMKKQFDSLTILLLIMILIGVIPIIILFWSAYMNSRGAFWYAGQYIPALSAQELAQFGETKILVLPKTMWDFLQLLIVPFLLGVFGVFYTQQRVRLDQKIADDQKNEEILQKYIESVGEIILGAGYDKDKENPIFSKNQVTISEARTQLVFRQLDVKRKSNVVYFLYNSNLIGGILPGRDPFGGIDHTRPRILSLKKMDLSSIDLSHSDLPGINLSQSDLTKANFENAKMPSAILFDTEHKEIRIKGANFKNATLPHDW